MSTLTGPQIVDNRYLLHEKLGQGGMGTVYRASHRLSGRVVALKIIRRDGTIRAQYARSSRITIQPHLTLAREFLTLSSLHHPNIIQVIDYGFTDDFGPYFTMELLDQSQTLLEAAAALPLPAKLQLVGQLLRALDYLHRRGIIHRDLKPSNVLCIQNHVKVVDFGLATSDRSRNVAGTLDYIAPEILRGDRPSEQSDLYALGVIMSQLVNNRLPHEWRKSATPDAPTEEAITQPHTVDALPEGARSGRDESESPQPAVIDTGGGPIGAIMRRLLSARPADRHADAVEVLHDLNRCLDQPLPVETVATRESFLRASSLIGREEETSVVSSALEATRHGRGSAWLLGGESGVGKSRLLSETRTLALVQEAVVAQGQAVVEGGHAYHLWLPVLGDLCLGVTLTDADAAVLNVLVPGLGGLLGRPIPAPPALASAAARERLFLSVESLFRQQKRPIVVLLEDLHWADADSLGLLSHLCRLTTELPLLIVGTYRDDEAPRLPESLSTMNVLKLQRLTKEQVAGLSESMLGAVAERPGLVDYLYRQTEGNVLFLIEILRELATEAGQLDRISHTALPEHLLTGGIERFAARRIDRVSEAHQRVLDLAAVFGRQLDLGVLQRAIPSVDLDSWLLACSNASLIERRADEWRFAHDKLREVILAAVPRGQVARLHRQLAEAVEGVYAGDLDAKSVILAYHYGKAGKAERAWVYNVRAADVATRLCSYAEARRLYAAALEELGKLDESDENRRREIDTLLKQVHTSLAADRADENFARMKVARAALDTIASQGPLSREDNLRLARVNSATGRIHYYRGEAREALDYYRKVLPVAQASGDEELAALPSCMIGNALAIQGQMRQAEPLLAQAIEPLERLGEPFEWFRAVGYHGLCLIGLGQYTAGVAQLNRILARAAEVGQPTFLSATHLMCGSTYLVSGDWPLVIQHLEKVLDLANQTGDKLHLSLAWNGIGWAKSCLHQHWEAKACRARGQEIAQAMGGRLVLADWYQAADAEIALNAGDSHEALHLAETVATASAAAGLLFSHGVAERVWGEVLSRRGEVAQGDSHMRRSIEVLDGGGVTIQATRSRVCWALQQRSRGEISSAETLFDLAHQELEASGCAYALAEAERLWNTARRPTDA